MFNIIRSLKFTQTLRYSQNLSSSKQFVLSPDVTINKNMQHQGIGSGAGYIELDNGTFSIDPSLN